MPPCPITGDASPVKVQRLTMRFLFAMWRHWHGVTPTPVPRDGPALVLYRSACGLMFFHPPIAGDAAFYRSYYEKLGALQSLSHRPEDRPEFVEAARHVRPGDRVLDVGAGRGGLEALLPEGATWQGLDPHLGEDVAGVARETLEAHAARHPGAYDVVCAFQVLEHVEDPRSFAATMASCLRPGGRLVICVPLWPSPWTEIPNFALNAPPHHLTWWTTTALEALAGVLGLRVLRAEALPPPRHVAAMLWMHRLLPRRTSGDIYFAHRWSWWLSLLAAGVVARPLLRWRDAPLPPGARPIDAFLVAEKPREEVAEGMSAELASASVRRRRGSPIKRCLFGAVLSTIVRDRPHKSAAKCGGSCGGGEKPSARHRAPKCGRIGARRWAS